MISMNIMIDILCVYNTPTQTIQKEKIENKYDIMNNKYERKGNHMSSKKYAKNNKQQNEFKSMHSPVKVWAVRIVVFLLCIAVAITLIPSVFF